MQSNQALKTPDFYRELHIYPDACGHRKEEQEYDRVYLKLVYMLFHVPISVSTDTHSVCTDFTPSCTNTQSSMMNG